jgi:hypothetical protein
MDLSSFTASTAEQTRIARIVWALFNAERDQFKVRVLFFSIDLSDRVAEWLTAKFGPNPTL